MVLLYHRGASADVAHQLRSGRAQLDVRQLLPWMRDNLLTERPELFMKEDSV